MRRIIGLLVAGLMCAAGLLAIVGIPSFAGGSGAGVAAAAVPAQQIGMKVLLITSSTDGSTGDGAAYLDWQNTLNREGVPNDTVVTSSQGLPALSSTASDGTEVANYQAVIVAGSGLEGMSTAQWTTLQTFEQHFSVRQLTANAVPGPSYGLNVPANGGDSLLAPATSLSLTADGNTVFPYLKSLSFDSTYATYGAEEAVAPNPGGTVDTLISGPLTSGTGSSSMLGIYTTPDGRQTMYQTFNMGPGYLQSELLRHGELAWLTRGTYFGDQRNYLETHIDDNFLSDDSWCATPAGCGSAGTALAPDHSTDYNPADALRESPTDVTQAQTWSASHGNFRIDMLFNGGGSTQWATDHSGTDPLVAAFKAAKGSFGWINHTWDHPNLDQGCATQTYIEAEIQQNTNWASGSSGLDLASDPSATGPALGTENPDVVVTGEHSGLANLIPGNPGTVDPPEFDVIPAVGTGGSLAAGTYEYAITDQFSATGAQSSASTTQTGLVPAGSTATLTWDAVCHAAEYNIYRAAVNGTTVGPWYLVHTEAAGANDFTNPTSTSDTTGGGAQPKSWTDPGTTPATTSVDPTTLSNAAKETPYEQNTALTAAFAPTGAGITDFGSDASKPYPNPADAADSAFAAASQPGTASPAGATFKDGGATAIPRYPTNIYYNVSTQAQEVDEFNYLYEAPPNGICDSTITTCIPAPGWTFQKILDSIVGVNGAYVGMFQHMMGNDPRPDYFHQTNMMGTPPPTGTTSTNLPSVGDGLYYSVMDDLLNQYNQYFQSNAPIEQLTMSEIGTLLNEQNNWATVNRTLVAGSIEGSTVTVNNSGPAVEVPLTGTNVGTAYAGTVSGWTSAPHGSSTYTAVTPWPALPTTTVVVTLPTGPAPTVGSGTTPKPAPGTTTHPATPAAPVAPAKHVVNKPIAYVAVQVKPKTVSIKHGKVTVSLQCRATKGKTARNKLCAGSFTLKASGHKMSYRFRFRSSKTHRFTVKLSTKVMSATARARRHHHHRMVGSLLISTTQTHAKSKLTHGTLTIRI